MLIYVCLVRSFSTDLFCPSFLSSFLPSFLSFLLSFFLSFFWLSLPLFVARSRFFLLAVPLPFSLSLSLSLSLCVSSDLVLSHVGPTLQFRVLLVGTLGLLRLVQNLKSGAYLHVQQG